LVHVTVVPAATVSVAGPNVKLSIFTSALAAPLFSCSPAPVLFVAAVRIAIVAITMVNRHTAAEIIFMIAPSGLPIALRQL
jgi:hypothetical protein